MDRGLVSLNQGKLVEGLFCVFVFFVVLRQEKQLAAAPGGPSGGSLLLPRHHSGHPCGVPEDCQVHVLPLDV